MNLLDVILHIDTYLDVLIQNYGSFTYAILFLVIFLETGLVATPFFPGDSLLFAAGTFAARGSLSALWLFGLLGIAAIAGDTLNYWIGYHIGPRVFRREKGLFFNREYLVRTRLFYEKHGAKTIVIGRFLPIIRTFAPFVAGIGKMAYPRFLFYNVFGGLLWVGLFVAAGYWFGTIPFVQENFSAIIIAIIIISLIPAVWEAVSHRWHAKKYAR
jgi:membrane-associated protein